MRLKVLVQKIILFYTQNYWLLLLFCFYSIYILINSQSVPIGDEPRYLRHASYMLNGAYTNAEDPEFLSGPGYPVLILPFVALKVSLHFIHMINAFLLVGAVTYFFLTLKQYVAQNIAVIFSLIFGLYPFNLPWLTYAYTETLALFLVCAFIYHFCLAVSQQKILGRNQFVAMFMLGWLILTKVVFFYVVVVVVVVALFVGSFHQKRKAFITSLIGAGSFLLCIPYLAHTYQLTGVMMYWSTGGGQHLYFHAAPFENEFGNWYSDKKIWSPRSESSNNYFGLEDLSKNHLDFYKTLPYRSEDSATVTFERDTLFRAKAKEYLRESPQAFFRNTIASFNRFFFNFPRSYVRENLGTIKYVWVNMFIVVLTVLFIYPAFIGRKLIPYELWVLILMVLTFLGCVSLLSAWTRHLLPVIPVFLLFIAFIFDRVLEIRILKS